MNKYTASDKLCPFGFANSNGIKYCVTDSCMLWKWDRVTPQGPTSQHLTFPITPIQTTESTTQGSCGLIK